MGLGCSLGRGRVREKGRRERKGAPGPTAGPNGEKKIFPFYFVFLFHFQNQIQTRLKSNSNGVSNTLLNSNKMNNFGKFSENKFYTFLNSFIF